jgi:hypothetical protein
VHGNGDDNEEIAVFASRQNSESKDETYCIVSMLMKRGSEVANWREVAIELISDSRRCEDAEKKKSRS